MVESIPNDSTKVFNCDPSMRGVKARRSVGERTFKRILNSTFLGAVLEFSKKVRKHVNDEPTKVQGMYVESNPNNQLEKTDNNE